MTDQDWIQQVQQISDPIKMLRCILDNQDFLGYDPYYSDLRGAMLLQIEKILSEQEQNATL